MAVTSCTGERKHLFEVRLCLFTTRIPALAWCLAAWRADGPLVLCTKPSATRVGSLTPSSRSY